MCTPAEHVFYGTTLCALLRNSIRILRESRMNPGRIHVCIPIESSTCPYGILYVCVQNPPYIPADFYMLPCNII